MTDLRVLLLSDGRPGHYRLSEGVVAAIRRIRSVEVDWLELRRPRLLPKAFVPKLSRRLPPALALHALHGLRAGDITKPDLVISAGGLTLGVNVALARIFDVPNIFCGATRGFATDRFALVLTDDPRQAGSPNVVIGPKPSVFDPDDLPSPNPIDRTGASIKVGVLVGGPIESAEFNQADWRKLAALLVDFARGQDAEVVVITGPRTPPAAYSALEPAAAACRTNMTLVDFRTAGPGSSGLGLAADLVLVTSDSMSMMTEAALSSRPAIALQPARTAPSRDDPAIAWLVERGWLALADLQSATPDSIRTTAMALTPLRENHLDRLARDLAPVISHA